MLDDRDLDIAIDDVARQMIAGEPDGGLRARVLARIESGFGIRDSGFGRWRPAARTWRPASAGLSAAALILVAVVVFWYGHGHRVTEGPVAQAPAQSAPPAQVFIPAHRDDARRVEVRLKPDATYRYSPDPTSAIDALAPPPLAPSPLDVDSIAVGTLPSADRIQLDTLETITPIAVIPLGEGDRP